MDVAKFPSRIPRLHVVLSREDVGVHYRVVIKLAFAVFLRAIFEFKAQYDFLKILHNILHSQLYQQELDNKRQCLYNLVL